MGVKDLWQLLAPIGRKVSIETLEGKTLAIDASIWITQFIKAMRDEDGQMVKNAHLLGTLRRILKLLFHRIQPIFVFDGATPMLKQKVLSNRRKQHDKAEGNKRLAAQKILMSQLKQQELRNVLKTDDQSNSKFIKSFNPLPSPSTIPQSPTVSPIKSNQLQNGTLKRDNQNNSSLNQTIENNITSPLKEPPTKKKIQRNHLIIDDDINNETAATIHPTSESITKLDTNTNQLDRLYDLDPEEDVDYDDEEDQDLVPETADQLDVHALSKLPAHRRKNIIEEARKKERIKSRSTYLPVAGDPALYSKMQLKNFLTTRKLNSRIEEVQKKIDSKGVGVHKIAAEGKRKYVLVDQEDKIPSKYRKNVQKMSGFYQSDEEDGEEMVGGGMEEGAGTGVEMIVDSDDETDKLKPTTTHRLRRKDAKDTQGRPLEIELQFGNGSSVNHPIEILEDPVNDSHHLDGKEMEECGEEDGSVVWEDETTYEFIDCGSTIEIDLTEIFNSASSHIDSKAFSLPTDLGTDGPHGMIVSKREEMDRTTHTSMDIPPTSDAVLQRAMTTASNMADWAGRVVRHVLKEHMKTTNHHQQQHTTSAASHLKETAHKAIQEVVRLPSDVIEIDRSSSDVIDTSERKPQKDIIIPSLKTDSEEPDHSNSLLQTPPLPLIALNDLPTLVESSSKPPPLFASDVDCPKGIDSSMEVISVSPDVSASTTANPPCPSPPPHLVEPSHHSKQWVDIESNTIHPLYVDTLPTIQDDMVPPHTPKTVRFEEPILHDDSFHQEKQLEMNSPFWSKLETNGQNLNQSEPDFIHQDLVDLLQNEQQVERTARKKLSTALRDSESLTTEMKEEVIELLQIFSIPYLIAPFEAEAQCAALEQLGLVDGVVTEDSDAFLFGAKSVYKNIFNDRKFVEVYLAEDAKREMGLSREDFVALAYFLGSDYADGVNGIGIVNALEILQVFSMREETGGPVHGLTKFKEWVNGYDFAQQVRDKVNKKNRKKLSKEKKEEVGSSVMSPESSGKGNVIVISDEDESLQLKPLDKKHVESFETKMSISQSTEVVGEGEGEGGGDKPKSEQFQLFEMKHLSGREKWLLPDNFPDKLIATAYLDPKVNKNTDSFPKINPDFNKIRVFCQRQLGWMDTEINKNVLHVIKRYTDRSLLQTRIDSHFMAYHDDLRFAKIASNRLKKAVIQITGKSEVEKSPIKKQNSRMKKSGKKNLGNTESIATDL